MVLGIALVLVGAVYGLYRWRAHTEYRALESTWISFREDLAEHVGKVGVREETFEANGRHDFAYDSPRKRLLEAYDALLVHIETSRPEVEEITAVTFGGREIRSRMSRVLGMTLKYFAQIRSTWGPNGGDVDAALEARTAAAFESLHGSLESFRSRWGVKQSPEWRKITGP